jgi:ribosomal protein S18 acetylase RimI-like enzyme
MHLRHRPYLASDRQACTALFAALVPRFFHEREVHEFTDFLERSGHRYLVVLADGERVGCGGFRLSPDGRVAHLCWGLVGRDHHAKGIGAYLLHARLHAIESTTAAACVRLVTTQHTEGFYRRYGFEVHAVRPDGIAAGLDEVEMQRVLGTAPSRLAGV